MISINTIGRFKEEIKPINLDEPVDPFNYMLTAYPPVSITKYSLMLNILNNKYIFILAEIT